MIPACFRLLSFIFLLAASLYAPAQQLLYLNPGKPTAGYYLSYQPEGEIKGLLLLLPGFGETPEAAAAETSIPATAVQQGLICILSGLPEGRSTFYIDSSSQAHLDRLIEALYDTYTLKGKKFYLGGFSLGGTGAVKYAERAVKNKKLKQPHAVFAIDPPLDFERFYHSQEKAIVANFHAGAVQEANYFLNRIKQEFGASPAENLSSYYQLSPFSFSDPSKSAVKNLAHQPILLISEPAPLWQKQERGRDYSDLNAYDCDLFIQQLQQVGNKDARLLFTKNKGFRKQQNLRHPHAWSIADAEETVRWLLSY